MHDVLRISKALGDESRLRALLSLQGGELCLCQLIDVLGLSPATVSRHMSLLYQAGLVRRRKQGKWQFYRLVDGDGEPVARRALDWVLAGLERDPAVREHARRVRRVRRRGPEESSTCYRS